MSAMSMQGNGSNLGTSLERHPEASRFLDNPDCVAGKFDSRLKVRGRYTALLRECRLVRSFSSDGYALSWTVCSLKSLLWGHTSALLRLEGASSQSLLGEDTILLRSRERPMYASVPGHDDVWLALIEDNPRGMPLPEMFHLAHERLELSGLLRS